MRIQSFAIHITQEFRKHIFDYLLLFTFGTFTILLLSIVRGNHLAQFIILFAFVNLYFLWSIIHHFQTKSLRYQIVLEYILIAATTLFILKIVLLD